MMMIYLVVSNWQGSISMDKFVVIANWDSCDSVVYGLFDSIEDANEFCDNWEWDEYDSRHEFYLQVEKLRGVK